MTILLTIITGILFAVGMFLMMRPHLMKFALGLMCFTNAANLLIFSAGRLKSGVPPGSANPLSQALILTAIVIGFGFLAFTLVLLFRLSTELGTVESRVVTADDEEA